MPLVIIGWTRTPNKNDGISLHGPLEHHIDGTSPSLVLDDVDEPAPVVHAGEKAAGEQNYTHANREPMAGGARGTDERGRRDAQEARVRKLVGRGEARPDRTDPDCQQTRPEKSRLLRPMESGDQERQQHEPRHSEAVERVS